MSSSAVAKKLQMLLTVSQVAALTNVSDLTIRREIKRGKFREVIYLTKTDMRIPADVYAEYIEHRTVRHLLAA